MNSAQEKPLILFFKDIHKGDTPLVGGKGANLGEMANAGFSVPPGFAITVHAYDKFLEENNLVEKIEAILKENDVDNSDILMSSSKKIEGLVLRASIPTDVIKEIISSYKKLVGVFGKGLVAVRSSATAEDLPDASFAGQQATLLNIHGSSNLLTAVKSCWASLFTARAIFYRVQNKISEKDVKISVIVQKMIQSDVSGVIFSIDPVTNLKDRIIVEAVWGLGEMIVQGAVIPDQYVVQKDTYSILSKEISEQSRQMIRSKNENIISEVPQKIRDVPKLNDKEITTLAKLSQKLQDHYYHPQDTEFAREKGKLYIVQTRPITTIAKVKSIGSDGYKTSDTPILAGAGASPGTGSGKVMIVRSIGDLSKIQKGFVLVAKMTSPDYVPAMKKAEAIITDEGGLTSHAAIVSRELGIPCVVGTKSATKDLRIGDLVTVDGTGGKIYLGSKTIKQEKSISLKTNLKTATKIYVNLAEVDKVKSVSKKNIEGVGLLRAEFMVADIGIHPKEAIKNKAQDKYINSLSEKISVFCKYFYPRLVVYRATDFKTNEYRTLTGGKVWEPVEANPMLGFRGAFRYISDPEVFALEIMALKKVQEKYKNISLMIPFVRSPEELKKVRRMVSSYGLFETSEFKFWMMVELPVNIILLEEYIKVGIDGVSIGSNDLTMLITGTDRDNTTVSQAFDERSPAVLWAIKKTIKTCNKYNITSSICGQAPSFYDDLVEKLVEAGITSISVNPDAIDRVRNIVYEKEKKLF